ncbi:trans-aconitate 2-methyltransferase [Nakamurella sp. YIM 132087]|uniref:Trans-aconitate 2-methyltransferase n=1 Tax=Nakamurella alba TaxID=2665158 RepID=A0A7K1FP11_9ACTN|nr:trans-aconitate 2-methyltransferase [Nakamurella alba]MTD15885.1 trans-aconitate 2-methyltransferase [Nakamurella alba]
MAFRWDPAQYRRHAGDRGRPFFDLVARIGADAPERVVDLGCGPGNLTVSLTGRWPQAAVEGIDSSAEMIEEATGLGSPVDFRRQDIADWTPPARPTVVVSNAALQWVPGHPDLLRGWLAALANGSWFALQIPGNFTAPSHVIMRELAESPRWAPQLAGVLRHQDTVLPAVDYAGTFLDAGWQVDAWETTYIHRLTGADPVVDWVRGTGLRPVLEVLQGADRDEFVDEYTRRIRQAYPPGPHGTLFPFRRIFAVGSRP